MEPLRDLSVSRVSLSFSMLAIFQILLVVGNTSL